MASDINIQTPPDVPEWRRLLRLRWPLGGAVALAFALGRLLEIVLLDPVEPTSRLVLDMLGWGIMAWAAVWVSMSWVSRQERRYQEVLWGAVREQQQLNQQLQRSNSHLALLVEVNQRIAESTSLDEVLDAGLAFPQRLVNARAAVLWLIDADGPAQTRVEGADASELGQLRAAFGAAAPPPTERHARELSAAPFSGAAACLILPLHDGAEQVGWVELYRPTSTPLGGDTLELVETIASEVAEAIVGARRRTREERAAYELERAIADERARIARDIHDGIAQSLAFMRMRVDLWREWISADPARLDTELAGLKGTLREQIRELRRAIFAMRPIQFDELGFVGGLHRYVVEFANQHAWEIQVDLHTVPPDLSREIEAACFRIVQEALTNVAKHAGASRVEVRLSQSDQGLQILVRDDGRGFESAPPGDQATDHVGLRQMRERLATLRGQLSIESQPGAGTRLRAWIPLH